MESRFRVNFINSLSGYKSANLIGSKSTDGVSNLAIFSSVTHLGADPALIGFISRPHSVERHTLQNIIDTKTYTINHVNQEIHEQAHQTSARYDAQTSEFLAVDLTEEYTSFPAPYVAQSKIKYGVKLREKIDIKSNNTIMIVGEIIEVIYPKDCVGHDGKLDLSVTRTCAISGLDEYHRAISLNRLEYAKSNKI